MKKELKAKLLFDLILTVVWIVLMIYSLTGSFWHEVLGIALFFLFVIHHAVNYKWIVAVTKKLFTGKFTINKIKYILDVLLLISVLLTTVSGVLISKELLRVLQVQTEDYLLWDFIHAVSAYASLIIISVHIGLHWKMIVEVSRKLLGIRQAKQARSITCKLFSAAVVLLGLKSSVHYSLPVYSSEDLEDDNEYALNIADDNSTTVASETGQTQTSLNKISFSTVAAAPESGETLEDYLGRLICTGCHNRCSLLSPRCGIGDRRAGQAENYYEKYNADVTSSEAQSAVSDESAANTKDESVILSDNSTDTKDDTSTDSEDSNEDNETGVGDILSVMGMYIAGTYYIVEFVTKKNI